jgi:hypothetical protein
MNECAAKGRMGQDASFRSFPILLNDLVGFSLAHLSHYCFAIELE